MTPRSGGIFDSLRRDRLNGQVYSASRTPNAPRDAPPPATFCFSTPAERFATEHAPRVRAGSSSVVRLAEIAEQPSPYMPDCKPIAS